MLELLVVVLAVALAVAGWWIRKLLQDVERLEDALEDAVFLEYVPPSSEEMLPMGSVSAEPEPPRFEVFRDGEQPSRWVIHDPVVVARHIANEKRQGASGQLIVAGEIVEEWGPLIGEEE